jgi:sigma-B regulation protein RsbU (phosphoserine phosphatase)
LTQQRKKGSGDFSDPAAVSGGRERETGRRRNVIIADDDLTTLKILERTLEKGGFRPIAVTSGTAVVEALSDDICAVILDIQMPGMNGLECLSYISRQYPDLAPIMLTASDAVSDAVYAMKQGAFDYIVKPFHAQQIRTLVEHAARSFEQTVRLRETEESLRRARENEIYVASRIQRSLLLGKPPGDFPGLAVASTTVPSQDIDGDFYDFLRLEADTMDIVVADVMGKGIRAAFLGAALKSYVFRVVSEARLFLRDRAAIEPEEIVDAVYGHMISPLTELESFVTLFYSRFHPRKRRLSYVDCGHVQPLHFHCRTGKTSLLKGDNMPLGFPEKKWFRQASVPFEEGDTFLFYSDGLTEAKRSDGELFGEKRLIACFERHVEADTDVLVNALKSEVIDFTGSESFADDFTCLAVRIALAGIPYDLIGRQSLAVDSRMSELIRVRQFVRAFGKKYMKRAVDEQRMAGIELAAVELITNIIRHAYDGEPGHPIRIEAEAFVREMIFDFYDQGRAFDPGNASQPAFDGSREGGLGIYIIERSVDEISYFQNESGQNCARMIIRWS